MTKNKGVGRGFGGGQPSPYEPELAAQAEKLAKLDATDPGPTDMEMVDIYRRSGLTLAELVCGEAVVDRADEDAGPRAQTPARRKVVPHD